MGYILSLFNSLHVVQLVHLAAITVIAVGGGIAKLLFDIESID